MQITLVGRIEEINSEIVTAKSWSWNKYFSFKVKEFTQWVSNWREFYSTIKCFYMLNDVFNWQKIASQIQKDDKVMITWTPNFSIFKNKSWVQMVTMTLFVQSINILYKENSSLQQIDSSNEESSQETFSQGAIQSRENVEVKTVQLTKEESKEYKKSMWDILKDLLPRKDDELPL